jgi:hypothetical protein
MPQLPTNWDDPHPTKLYQNTYDPVSLLGTIPLAGSVSSPFDLSGWSKFALKVDPNGGTLLSGTTITIWGAPALAGPYSPVYGTTGAVASTIQCGSTGTQIITNIVTIEPLRYVEFVLGGTQDAARILTILAK